MLNFCRVPTSPVHCSEFFFASREETVAFMGDIQAMFHQVNFAGEYQDFLCFLWWPNGDPINDLVEYRMTVHLFGTISSPSCAAYALRKTADDDRSDCSAEVL